MQANESQYACAQMLKQKLIKSFREGDSLWLMHRAHQYPYTKKYCQLTNAEDYCSVLTESRTWPPMDSRSKHRQL
jgi:hypothetical protein